MPLLPNIQRSGNFKADISVDTGGKFVMTDFKAAFIDFSDDLLDGVISDLTKENE